MLRVRVDGGQLTTAALRAIGDVSTRYARDSADLTDRQNIQLHWIRIEDVPDIWKALEGVGLSTAEACGDVPRVVLGSPVAGIAADEIIDGTPAVTEIVRAVRRHRGVLEPAPQVQDGDLRFAAPGRRARDQRHLVHRRRAPRARSRLRRLGRRRAVHQPDAGRSGWASGSRWTRSPRSGPGVVSIFRDYGYRRLRNRARLKFLVADWGIEKFRQVLEDDYLHRDADRR